MSVMDVTPIIKSISGAAYYALPLMTLAANLMPGLPEELFIIAVGFTAASGVFPFWIAFLLVMPALVISDNMLYWFSRSGNKLVFRAAHKIFGSFATDHLELVSRRQTLILVVSRFFFQARFLGPFLCGVTKMDWKKFLIVDILAVTTYVWTMFGVAVVLRQRFADINDGAGLVIDILSVVAIGILAIIVIVVFKKRFISWIKRLIAGEVSFLGISKIPSDTDTK